MWGSVDTLVSNIGVYPGAQASVAIESNAGGGKGISVVGLASGSTLGLSAAGYDSDGNFTGNPSANWSVTGGIGSLLAVSESTNLFTAITAGSGNVVLTNASGDVLDSLSVSVSNSSQVSHIMARTATGGSGVAFNTLSVTASSNVSFYVAGYDANWNFVQNVSAVVLTNGDLRLAPVGPNPDLTPEVKGWKYGNTVLTVSNPNSSVTTNISVTVNPAVLNFVRISPVESSDTSLWFNATNVSADQGIDLYVYGYDVATNSLGLQSGVWTVSNGFGVITGAGSGVSSITIDARVATNGFTTAHTSNMVYVSVGSVDTLVSNIGVYPGAQASVAIESNAGGGKGISVVGLASGSTLGLSAAGYDSDGNFTGNPSANWSVTGGIGSLLAVSESTNLFTAITAGSGNVVLTNASGGCS